MEWKPEFLWFTSLNPDFVLVYRMETGNFQIPKFKNTPEKSCFYSVNWKNFWVPLFKLEKFPGFIP